jgi:hypothetical protein
MAFLAAAGTAVAMTLNPRPAAASFSDDSKSASPRPAFVLGGGLAVINFAVTDPPIDRRSFDLGIIAAFAEIVGAGVKTMALSEVLSPADADALEAEAGRIAQRNGVLIHREPDLLVTDLFPADVAKDKHVFLIYKGTTLEDYRRLKEDKARLEREGRYDAAARRRVAERFGRLLSYPQSRIDALLAERAR